MKYIKSFAAAAIVALCTSSCVVIEVNKTAKDSSASSSEKGKSGRTRELRNYETGDFQSLTLSGVGFVTYRQKEGTPSVSIRARTNKLDLMEVSVDNGTLNIDGSKIQGRITKRKLRIEVSSPTLENLVVNGAVNMTCQTTFEGGKINIVSTSASNLTFKKAVKAQDLNVSLNEASNFTASSIESQKLNLVTMGAASSKVSQLNCSLLNTVAGGSACGKFSNVSCDKTNAVTMDAANMNISSLACDNLNTAVMGKADMTIKGIEAQEITGTNMQGSDITLKGKAKKATYVIKNNGISDKSGKIKAKHCKVNEATAHIEGNGTITCHVTDSLKIEGVDRGQVKYKGHPAVRYSADNEQ